MRKTSASGTNKFLSAAPRSNTSFEILNEISYRRLRLIVVRPFPKARKRATSCVLGKSSRSVASKILSSSLHGQTFEDVLRTVTSSSRNARVIGDAASKTFTSFDLLPFPILGCFECEATLGMG